MQLGLEPGERYVCGAEPIGRGAYGLVHAALDKSTGRHVAIKAVADVRTATDLRLLLREMRFLRHLPHPNVLQMSDMTCDRSASLAASVRLVTPLFDMNLHVAIRRYKLSALHRQHIMVSICRGLAYMHAADVVHRDVKPSNILLNADLTLVIADLGLARRIPSGGSHLRPSRVGAATRGDQLHGSNAELSSYVVTRWFRPPELLASDCAYDCSVDSWSVGCVLAEMIRRVPLIRGEHTADQLKLIIYLLGQPAEEELERMKPDRATVHFIRSVRPPPERGATAATRLAAACPAVEGPSEMDLLVRLLTFDPAKRLRMADALEHAFLSGMHLVRERENAPPAPPVDMAFDRPATSASQLRLLIRQEVRRNDRPLNRLTGQYIAQRDAIWRDEVKNARKQRVSHAPRPKLARSHSLSDIQ